MAVRAHGDRRAAHNVRQSSGARRGTCRARYGGADPVEEPLPDGRTFLLSVAPGSRTGLPLILALYPAYGHAASESPASIHPLTAAVSALLPMSARAVRAC